RTRNGASASAAAATASSEGGEESPEDCGEGSNKRMRHEPAEFVSPGADSSLVPDETAGDCSDGSDSELMFAPRAPSADASCRQSEQQPHGPSQAPTEAEYQLSSPPQPHRRPQGTATRSPTMPPTSLPLAAAPAVSFASQAASPSDAVTRRPLTPHIASAVFDVAPEPHPASLTSRRYRHNRGYQNRDCAQPLTPTHSSTSLVTFAVVGVESDGPLA
ncbi:hypothetical protein IWQ56_007416, partial [Coemansia nantahalensis]